MDNYRTFRTEALDVERTWSLTETFIGNDGFRKFYTKNLFKIKLACRVLHKLRTYKRPQVEAIEIRPEDLPELNIQRLNTINTCLKPVYSLKIKCKIQINDWTLDTLGLIDTRCSNTILDQKLVPVQYHKPIPPSSQFLAEQMDGQLFIYTSKLDKCKLSFYLPDGTLTNYIHIEHK